MQERLRQTAQAVRESVALLKRTEELLSQSKTANDLKIKLPSKSIVKPLGEALPPRLQGYRDLRIESRRSKDAAAAKRRGSVFLLYRVPSSTISGCPLSSNSCSSRTRCLSFKVSFSSRSERHSCSMWPRSAGVTLLGESNAMLYE